MRRLPADKEQTAITITPDDLEEMTGERRFRYGDAEQEDRIGQVTGLAGTEGGGD